MPGSIVMTMPASSGMRRIVGVVHVQPDVMAQTVDEVPAERVALRVLAVRVDVVHRDLLQASLGFCGFRA